MREKAAGRLAAAIPVVLALLLAGWGVVGCDGGSGAGSNGSSSGAPGGGASGGSVIEGAERVLRIPMSTDGPNSLDPVRGSTVYENRAASMVYETLLDYEYLIRPPRLRPLLLQEMPKVSADGLTYSFKLKKGVRFQDDPCFPNGKGRELKTDDVFYSWKRMADNDNQPKSWWLLKNTIEGFDDYRDTQNKAAAFDYAVPVKGFQKVSDQEFKVVLSESVHRFVWTLSMFQTAIVPREAVEHYGERFGRHPVGTGPFTMAEKDWTPQGMTFKKNPTFREAYYPNEWMPEDEPAGLHLAAGKRIPFVDRVHVTFFVESQPMWLQFRAKNLDYTSVPAENFTEAFNKQRKTLKPSYRKEGIVSHAVPLLDFIFRAFNMEDELLGGYGPKKKALRQAICLALDWDEVNDSFYNGICIVYDGMIPPGLDGYPEEGKGPISFRGPQIERAKKLLAEAGYPRGEGLPEIDYYTGKGGLSAQMTEMVQRQLGAIDVRLNVRLVDFSALIEAVNKKKAPFFSFAWSSDYPDAENNLALFYGPNESPGSNHWNYKRPEYDKLYDKIRVMPPSEERTRIYEKMRDMVIEDAPFAGSMARTRFVLAHSRLKNFKPTEIFAGWVKYLDVDASVR